MSVSPSTIVRSELIGLIEQELLGPRNGPEEEIKGTPRAAYMVGALAPVTMDSGVSTGATDRDAVENTDDGADPNDTGQGVTDIDPTANGQRGVPTITDEDAGASVEAEELDEGPKGALTYPSSMGLRFQVPRDCGVLRVTATWGRYTSFRKENDEGRKFQWSKRTPVEKAAEIDVRDHKTHTSLDPITIDDDVTLRVELFPLADRMIVELALSNDRVTGMDAPPGDWLFQTKLRIEANSGEAVFVPTRDALLSDYDETDEERQRLDLQYRHRLEFAIGRTASVTWTEPVDDEGEGVRRATSVETTWLPTADVPQTIAGSAGSAVTSMRELAELRPEAAEAAFAPLVGGYRKWLGAQQVGAGELPEHLRVIADEAIGEAEQVAARLQEGIRLLSEDDDALKAFQFMNRAMRDQRIRTQVAAQRAADGTLAIEAAVASVEAVGDKAASWRPFQLAFILLQLPALTDPAHPYRSGDAANVELLFFPTGGGKTEAYLGLAAYTFAIRRLQRTLDTHDGVLDGGDGVAVLMRYTLRLLTSQQFQRAAALVCAAELIRQEDPDTWGIKPFSIGLWVGSAVSPKRYSDAEAQVKSVRANDSIRAFGLTVLQLQRCPWCGTKIDPKRDVHTVSTTERIEVYCGDRHEDCPFAIDGDADGPLPITTVDDEIYRNPPTFLLATVDKFARLAREGEAASLFGYVAEWCPRHGYRHPDTRSGCAGAQTHNAKTEGGVSYPKVTIQPTNRLRPPDLIIQDELHLITGALGTAVGVFENAVDLLSSYAHADTTVRPLIVASTATVRNAERQVRALYGRGVDVFPPQVLDVRDTFFSKEKPVTDEDPGRKYVGVCAHGIRLTLAEIRMSELLLLAGQKLLDEHGDPADPYLTTVGYFSATRELAGMRRYLDDDVTMRVAGNTEPFPRRTNDFARLNIGELTSRISAEEISRTLDRLALPFASERWSTRGKAAYAKAYREAMEAKKTPPSSPDRPYDVVLATSMLQVGVDVSRLGLMLVVGQPKNTAEYIQASSRVGRVAEKPGLVVSLANWSRPRDMAHFEQFRHYHETFYAQVEALSVTPYSETAMERGLMGVLVSAARVADARLGASLSPEMGAGDILQKMPTVQALIDELADRAMRAADDPVEAKRMRDKLVQRLDRWHDKAVDTRGALVYERVPKNQVFWPLLISPEATVPSVSDRVFVVANSMREVQPEINLLVSPSADRLAFKEPSDSPDWNIPQEGEVTEIQTGDSVVGAFAPLVTGAAQLDPIADVEANKPKNRSRVGSIRPSAMLYTNGVGATVDLPHLSVMPHGLDAWGPIYARRPGPVEVIAEPRLLELVRAHLGSQVAELRKPPWAPEEKGHAGGEAIDLGIPARIFPQWLRCTGCNLLAPVSYELFKYVNVNRFRPDQAEFVHETCTGWGKSDNQKSRKLKNQPAVPARYLIACANAHLDEFPYERWVHRGKACSKARIPQLRMREWKSNIGPDVQIMCIPCGATRGMLEATGPKAVDKLPRCRGRHAHLDAFYTCDQPGRLMMLGAANQWFPSTLGLLALPREEITSAADLVPLLMGLPRLLLAGVTVKEAVPMFKLAVGAQAQTDAFEDVDDEVLWEAIRQVRDGNVALKEVSLERRADPLTVLAPEWVVLTDEKKYTRHSGSADFRAVRRKVPEGLRPTVAEVVAVEKLKKVNAFIGFTRIDALDRIDDASARVAPLSRDGRPTWVPSTEDRGEGVFLQFDESVVAAWEDEVLQLPVWAAFREAHRTNFRRRTSKTAGDIDPDTRFPAPRYWAIHTLSHLLIREAAMLSGYGSASLAERIYAWRASEDHGPAAGLLIATTASDSEGTLGGLVELARPEKLARLVADALRRGQRCSSDPICAVRVPSDKEDFLHGAACHFCLFVSETSCERTNRFLDRRLLLGLATDPAVATPGLLQSLVEVR